MKLKGINSIEQHIEKVVLALVAIVFVGVLAMQFLLKPNSVEVAAGKKVGPEAIYAELAHQAQRLESQIKDPSPRLPEVPSTSLADQYERAMAEPIAPSERLAGVFGPAQQSVLVGELTDGTGDNPIAPTGPIVGLAVPQTDRPVASALWSSLDPFELAANPDLSEFIGESQPYDMPSVSVQVSFNGKQLQDALTGKPEQGQRGIPRKFWNHTGMTIMDVGVERQRRLADGSWSSSEPVTPVPGTNLPGERIEADMTYDAFVSNVREAAAEIESVSRPEFPATVSGFAWMPPVESSDRVAQLANANEVERILASIERVRQEIVDVRAGKSGASRKPGSGRPSTGSKLGAPGRGSPAPAKTRTTGRPGGSDAKQRKIDAQVKRREKEITRLEDKLEELGVDPNKDDRNAPGSRGSGRATPGGLLLAEEEFDVWAHDLGVEPGAAYRYRVRIGVNNPLYARSSVLDPNDPDQQSLASDPIAYGQWSEWSEPALVGAREYFFISNASESGPMSDAPRALAEVYTMYYGYYRKASVALEPGDVVAAEPAVGDGFYLLDAQGMTFDQAKQAVDAQIMVIERERDPDLRTGSSGDAPELIEGITTARGSIPVRFGVVLLDVARQQIAAGGGSGKDERAMVDVVLRDSDGSVLVLHPQSNDSPAYAMASVSAQQGRAATMRLGERLDSRAAPGLQPNQPGLKPSPGLQLPAGRP